MHRENSQNVRISLKKKLALQIKSAFLHAHASLTHSITPSAVLIKLIDKDVFIYV